MTATLKTPKLRVTFYLISDLKTAILDKIATAIRLQYLPAHILLETAPSYLG